MWQRLVLSYFWSFTEHKPYHYAIAWPCCYEEGHNNNKMKVSLGLDIIFIGACLGSDLRVLLKETHRDLGGEWWMDESVLHKVWGMRCVTAVGFLATGGADGLVRWLGW